MKIAYLQQFLSLLRTSYIDVFLLHRDDPEVQEEVARLREQKKISNKVANI